MPLLLRRAWYGLNQAFRRRLAHLGLTPDQFTVLRTLLENERITQKELARLMASDPNTVASLLERMEAGGLIEREPHAQDRRALCPRVRPAGRRQYESARAVAVALQTEILSILPSAQRERFLAQLAQIADACQSASRGGRVDDLK